ncbi:IclR family transcriptional regulator [Conexibacter sp. CPCC 206217]|uniref:IclR family transcriptional regulator n=1 Tax=Conexibacter sp. CPCC 206217 TaxID=3064574 RepID=UPI0027203649|nr:IclR family transcriptional regulator [Conexibacter sp. CPCC 206217]MDO8212076.1 IclR family transcriptional regulator [Conexibacter sp. CPCC 206217]
MASSAREGGQAPGGGPTPAYPIGSVDNALRLLLMFGERSDVRVSDASSELGVAASTAHRLLQMLQLYGFVRQDPRSKAYSAGPVWVNMGLRGLRSLDVRTVSRTHIEALVEEVRETVQLLGLQAGTEMICLDAVEGPYVVRAVGRLGAVLPAYATAGGRAVLSTLPVERVRQLYPARLKRLAPNTIVSRAELERELERVREQGYAVQREEMEPGVSAIAAPIRDHGGTASFAVDVVMPTARLAADDLPRIAAAAVDCAATIARELGL